MNPGASSDTQGQPRNPGPLDRCVVSLTAPELAAENLIGAAGLAEITGIAPSTLRAYIARGEADVPLPQAIISGRSLWARPVAEEWAEQRQRDPDAVDAAVSAPSHYGDPVPAGQAELAATLTRSFLADLWDYRPFRGRWALRWRSKDHVHEVAAALGHQAASYVLRTLIPAEALSVTLQHALLDDLAEGQRNHRAISADGKLRLAGPDDMADEMPTYYGIMPKIAEMLGWLATAPPPAASSPRSPGKPSADSASPATSPSRPSASPWTSTATSLGDVFTAPPGRPGRRGPVLAGAAGKYAAVTSCVPCFRDSNHPTRRHIARSAPASAADAALSLRR